jgi:hypothetical protein
MGEYVAAPTKTFKAAAAITQYARVYITDASTSPKTINTAGVTNDDIGTIQVAALAAGDLVAVRLRTAEGTEKMICAAAVTVGAEVYTAATGMINDVTAAGCVHRGLALEGGSGANSIIEVLPVNRGLASLAS